MTILIYILIFAMIGFGVYFSITLLSKINELENLLDEKDEIEYQLLHENEELSGQLIDLEKRLYSNEEVIALKKQIKDKDGQIANLLLGLYKLE